MAPRTNGLQESFLPEAIFHEPGSVQEHSLRFATFGGAGSVRKARRPAPKRRRTIRHVPLSAKLDDDTNWRLTLYCGLTGYGVKDAVMTAANGFLSLGPYPKRLNPKSVREQAEATPFVQHDRRQTISIRVDPAFLEAIEQDADEMQISESAWVELALKKLFDHVRLPSKGD